MRRSGLSRHIVVSMSLMALSVIVMVILSSYVLYAILVTFYPGATEEPASWAPSGPELVWMAGVTLIGLGLAIAASVRLSQRILGPLNSVVDSIRRLANGDLGARAAASHHSLGEVALLVDDFNAMARRLQNMDADRVMWHAAIAHELRTPVTILRGRLQGLAEGVFAPDEAQFRSLLAQVEGLSRLIEDLRVLSLADSARLDVRRARSDVVQEVHSVMTLVAPGKDDDAGWKKYLQAVAVQNMGNITNSPFLYYLGPESDPQFQDKYERQVESATQAVARGVQPGNMLAFGSSASGKMADMIQTVFKDVSPDSMKGVRVVFIGQAADNARVQSIVQPTGAEYIFVEAK